MKGYPNLTLDYVLYEMSYANLILYSSVLPSYDDNDNNLDNDLKEEKKKAQGLKFGEFMELMKGL